MLPMLKQAKIIHYIDAIVKYTDRFIDDHLHDNDLHKDLSVHCKTLLMNIIGFIVFNYDLNSTTNLPMKKALEDFAFQASLIMPIPGRLRWLVKIYLKFNWKYQRLRRLIQELIEKIIEHEQNNQNPMKNERPRNLISSLVSSLNEQANDENISSGLTRDEILDGIITLIFGGYETIATALSWFIFYMSKHPRIQQRIKEELQQHHLFMTDDAQCLPSLTQEILDSLVYCECVMKEV